MEKELEYEFKKLGKDRVDEITNLEKISMTTDTTFPLTKEELLELFKNGYIVFGYESDDGLIAKVGFTKSEDRKFELDVCVHPDYQGKGIGKKIMRQSIKELLSEDDSLDIFLKVHPNNSALGLYEKVGFEGQKEDDKYKINSTEHGPRVTMDYKK